MYVVGWDWERSDWAPALTISVWLRNNSPEWSQVLAIRSVFWGQGRPFPPSDWEYPYRWYHFNGWGYWFPNLLATEPFKITTITANIY